MATGISSGVCMLYFLSLILFIITTNPFTDLCVYSREQQLWLTCYWHTFWSFWHFFGPFGVDLKSIKRIYSVVGSSSFSCVQAPWNSLDSLSHWHSLERVLQGELALGAQATGCKKAVVYARGWSGWATVRCLFPLSCWLMSSHSAAKLKGFRLMSSIWRGTKVLVFLPWQRHGWRIMTCSLTWRLRTLESLFV